MIEIGRYQQGQWQSRRPPLLREQTEAEAVAERIGDSIEVLGSITVLWRSIVGNLMLLSQCATDEAYDNLILTVQSKADAIGRLLPQLTGELLSAPWHLEATELQPLMVRLMDITLRRSTVSVLSGMDPVAALELRAMQARLALPAPAESEVA